MDVKRMLYLMAARQDELNVIANGKGWVNLHREWWRAIWLEAGELLQHFGMWEWWKKTTPDMPQVKLEMIDILHFGLSDSIQHDHDVVEVFLPYVDQGRAGSMAPALFIEHVETVALRALGKRRFSPSAFFEAWHALGASFDELYRLYMAKSVLNEFRQKHGYKEGTYQKVWAGREDNYHLVGIVEGMPEMSEDAALATYVYEKLREKYQTTLSWH